MSPRESGGAASERTYGSHRGPDGEVFPGRGVIELGGRFLGDLRAQAPEGLRDSGSRPVQPMCPGPLCWDTAKLCLKAPSLAVGTWPKDPAGSSGTLQPLPQLVQRLQHLPSASCSQHSSQAPNSHRRRFCSSFPRGPWESVNRKES